MKLDNRIRFAAIPLGLTLLAAILSNACGQSGDQTPAIRKAIETHLSQRPDLAMDQMTMELKTIEVKGDTAAAEVIFRVTNNPEMQMDYQYELVREGAGWKVSGGKLRQAQSPPPGGADSPGGTALPEGHPPLGGSPPDGGAMPEGHPPLSNNP